MSDTPPDGPADGKAEKNFPIPIVRCELPEPTAIVINDDDAGLFALVDVRVPDDHLARLASHLDLGLDLYAELQPPPFVLHLSAPRAAQELRMAIAQQITEQTRAHLAEAHRPRLVVEPPAVSEPVTTPDAGIADHDPPIPVDEPDERPELDLMGDRPHPARAYDYAMGGKTNYYADRELFENVLQVYPTIRSTALSNRAFMHRAVRYLARNGIDQFIDIGTGIPTEPNLHQVAQEVNPAARIVYVDNDPIVLAHAAALMVSTPQGRTAYVHADAREPAAILDNEELRATLDLSRPVAISALALLHFLDDDQADQLIRTLMDAVPGGSALVLSHATLDHDGRGVLRGAVDAYQKVGITVSPRHGEHIQRVFLDRLEVVEPGLVAAHRWRPDDDAFAALSDDDLTTYGVVARKPGGEPGNGAGTAAARSSAGAGLAGPALATAEAISEGTVAAPIDLMIDRPHSARMYDYFLGGKTNFEADRVAGDAVIAGFPTMPLAARGNRAFMRRAVAYAAGEGIGQFLDIGTGIPTEPNLHQVVQAINPAARIVYVDNDPIVLAHAAALLTSDPAGAVSYVHADAREPAAILAADELVSLLDPSRPVAVSIFALMHFLDDVAGQALVDTLLDAVPSGSFLMLSQSTHDVGGPGQAATEKYRAAGIRAWPRSRTQLMELFLGGLDLVDPGITFVHRWRPTPSHFALPADSDISLYAAVARKP